MPIAQQHYPFENKPSFEQSFPADYIGEGLDQTRLWFYVLHVISSIIFEKPAYKNVLVNGMVMAADGQKLSKRLKNYPPLEEVFDNEGADTLRYYLLSSSPAVSADYMRFDRDSLKGINRNLFMTLYNSAAFLSMYAQIDDWQPEDLQAPEKLSNPLDIWLINRVNQAVQESTAAMDKYELDKASRPVYELVDDISNWYVRRSRRRFWKSEDDSDKLSAYKSLHWALTTTCQLLAPWSPFMSDWLYRHLTDGIKGAAESVHLSRWPEVSKVDKQSLQQMQLLRRYVNEGLAQRAESKIKVRQPLGSAIILGPEKLEQALAEIIAEELNVKTVDYKETKDYAVELDTTITSTLRNEGLARDIIRNVQSARKEAGLEVENRIKLALITDSKVLQDAIAEFGKLIAHETLAEEISAGETSYGFGRSVEVDKEPLQIKLEVK